MSLPDPRAHYALDARLRADEMSRLRKGGRVYIAVKLAAFVLGLLGFSRYLAPRPGLAAALLAGFASVFSAAAILHERIIRRTAAEKRLLQVDEEEQRALDGEFLPFGSAGEEFADPVHPYSSDLDLFGLHSLFHFLGRTATGPGRRTLAQALLRPLTGPEIREAQTAVRELAGKPDFRRRIRAAALQAGSGGSPGDSYVPPAEQKEFLLGKPLLPVFLVAASRRDAGRPRRRGLGPADRPLRRPGARPAGDQQDHGRPGRGALRRRRPPPSGPFRLRGDHRRRRK